MNRVSTLTARTLHPLPRRGVNGVRFRFSEAADLGDGNQPVPTYEIIQPNNATAGAYSTIQLARWCTRLADTGRRCTGAGQLS